MPRSGHFATVRCPILATSAAYLETQNGIGDVVNKSRLQSAEPRGSRALWAALLLLGTGIAALLTAGGVRWLSDQLALADTFKAELVTVVLGTGLVILGPTLLLGLVFMLPRGWFRAAAGSVRKWLYATAQKNGASRF
jgi:hypothetical protein